MGIKLGEGRKEEKDILGRNSNICEEGRCEELYDTLPEQNRGAGALAGNETGGLTRSRSASCAAARSLKYPESSEDIMSDFKVGVTCTVKKEHSGNNAEDTLARDETGNRESGDQSIKDESNSSQDPKPRTGGQK